MQWHEILNPVGSLFTFRLPWHEGSSTFFDGDVFLPVWGLATTTECKIAVAKDAIKRSYDHKTYLHLTFLTCAEHVCCILLVFVSGSSHFFFCCCCCCFFDIMFVVVNNLFIIYLVIDLFVLYFYCCHCFYRYHCCFVDGCGNIIDVFFVDCVISRTGYPHTVTKTRCFTSTPSSGLHFTRTTPTEWASTTATTARRRFLFFNTHYIRSLPLVARHCAVLIIRSVHIRHRFTSSRST